MLLFTGSLRVFLQAFGVVSGAPTTIGIHFSKPLEFHARFWYLSTSSCSFSIVFSDTAISTKSAVLLSCTTTIAGHLCSITQSLWTLTYQRILISLDTYIPEDFDFVSVSVTGSTVCQYHCSKCGKLYFSHWLQWTILPSYLFILVIYL